MDKGQRAAESLRDSDKKDQTISECLLLYVIANRPGIDLIHLREKLKKIWEKIQEKNPKFYFFWGKYSDGHDCQNRDLKDTLKLFADCGYIEIPNGFCYITYLGLKLLTNAISKYDLPGIYWVEVKNIVSE